MITKLQAEKCLKILITEGGYKAYDKILSVLPNDSEFRHRLIKKKRWLKKFGKYTTKQRRPRRNDPKPGDGRFMNYLIGIKIKNE